MKCFSLGTAAAIIVGMVCALSAGPVLAQTEARYGTRSPHTCPRVTSQPNEQQISALVQCTYEKKTDYQVFLTEEVKVEVGKTRPYIAFSDSGAFDIDPTAKVLPIRGTKVSYICGPVSDYGAGKNCNVFRGTKGSGECWKTTFGTWSCSLTMDDMLQQTGQPPPGM